MDTYRVGQRFRLEPPTAMINGEHILAQVDICVVNLIALNTGERVAKGLQVEDAQEVSKKEFDEQFYVNSLMGGGVERKWVLISEPPEGPY